ncbi:putative Trehalose-phosphatase TPS2 [Paratrimastix pyriformis]|uniref:Trehalose-phosphatase TPS2 n=1 Tax=Paratrimastix pyriformis TaxID=342808 RepID=A0ABQ8UB41_9EUKA|nr:putative Trehalose-phosphatase TPS2 [Paratrimastix pyriformis]
MMRWPLLLLAGLACVLADLPENFEYATNSFVSDFVTSPVYPSQDPLPHVVHSTIIKHLPDQDLTVHLVRLTNPLLHFHVYPSLTGCPGRNRTSDNAQARGCFIAGNAGFFDTHTGACLGHVVSEGHLVQLDAQMHPSLALSRTTQRWAVGYMNEVDIVPQGQNLVYDEVVNGIGWLVREGQPYLNTSQSAEKISQAFVNLFAPRMAAGHDINGQFLMLEVDGLESANLGAKLTVMTELALEYGLYNAINLDGGGSTTVYMEGAVRNRCCDKCAAGHEAEHCPAGWDGACQRAVTTILCIR